MGGSSGVEDHARASSEKTVQQSSAHVTPEIIALSLVLLVGISLRAFQLARAMNAPLDPDTLGYMKIAQNILHGHIDFTQDNIWAREPLYPLIVALSLKALAFVPDYVGVRITSMIASDSVILVTFFLARQLFDKKIALVSSLLVASNAILVVLSTRGLREDCVSLLILALMFFILRAPNSGGAASEFSTDKDWLLNHIAPAAVLSLLIVLTRAEMVLFTITLGVLMFSYSSIGRSKRRSLFAAVLIASAVGVVIDLLVFHFLTPSLYIHNGSASFLYWWEFSPDHTTPFYRQGIDIGLYDYLFRYHSLPGLLLLELKGIKFLSENLNALLLPYPIWNRTTFVDLYTLVSNYFYSSYPALALYPVMAYIVVISLVHALRRQRTSILVLPLLPVTAVYCFTYGVMNVGDSIRYIAQFFPFLFIIVVAFIKDTLATRHRIALWSTQNLKQLAYYGLGIVLLTVVLLSVH